MSLVATVGFVSISSAASHRRALSGAHVVCSRLLASSWDRSYFELGLCFRLIRRFRVPRGRVFRAALDTTEDSRPQKVGERVTEAWRWPTHGAHCFHEALLCMWRTRRCRLRPAPSERGWPARTSRAAVPPRGHRAFSRLCDEVCAEHGALEGIRQCSADGPFSQMRDDAVLVVRPASMFGSFLRPGRVAPAKPPLRVACEVLCVCVWSAHASSVVLVSACLRGGASVGTTERWAATMAEMDCVLCLSREAILAAAPAETVRRAGSAQCVLREAGRHMAGAAGWIPPFPMADGARAVAAWEGPRSRRAAM